MLKRRNIRESAVQFLYLADLEDTPEAAEMQDTFWQITQETSLRKLAQAKAKAILHVAQGRDHRIAKLIERAPLSQAELKATDGTAPLVSSLNKVLRQERQLSDAIEQLKTSVKNKGNDTLPADHLDAVILANTTLISHYQEWHQTLEDFPAWRNRLDPITAAINHLARVSDRLSAIDDPESTIGSFAHLRASHAEIAIFRKETQALVQGILRHKQEIDTALAAVIENYAPSRVAPVDRAILRLATYEIKHVEDIPKAVSINEAIEIAKRFGSTDSARFINGVLDAL
ncbi:MAG: transcription antitermination factor NusB [Verrucomicrobiae bacterium]|nr:transcription antitermination factor NusB [Verrucomicrobiae bacterium]NNJ44112.1 transcription antitermination factor NusB [Akkermansiaceae bacterium]